MIHKRHLIQMDGVALIADVGQKLGEKRRVEGEESGTTLLRDRDCSHSVPLRTPYISTSHPKPRPLNYGILRPRPDNAVQPGWSGPRKAWILWIKCRL